MLELCAAPVLPTSVCNLVICEITVVVVVVDMLAAIESLTQLMSKITNNEKFREEDNALSSYFALSSQSYVADRLYIKAGWSLILTRHNTFQVITCVVRAGPATRIRPTLFASLTLLLDVVDV